MEREKGIAYCGLACCVCSENVLAAAAAAARAEKPANRLTAA